MSSAKFLATVVGAAWLCAVPAALAADAAPSFAITGVRVFDGDRVIPRATVVGAGGKVVVMGPAVKVPVGATVIDGKGKTLLPGLIDAHTHTFGAGPSMASPSRP
ncbi:hypothetical protein [Phenylobacterium sp.]|uniref:hypothetical protein n=1 Tax=Phenylobacterium sp. TaxID=1871053 RepID=UPI0025F280C8|nr:hypothetical protein [Phenylobacterium sp.]